MPIYIFWLVSSSPIAITGIYRDWRYFQGLHHVTCKNVSNPRINLQDIYPPANLHFAALNIYLEFWDLQNITNPLTVPDSLTINHFLSLKNIVEKYILLIKWQIEVGQPNRQRYSKADAINWYPIPWSSGGGRLCVCVYGTLGSFHSPHTAKL